MVAPGLMAHAGLKQASQDTFRKDSPLCPKVWCLAPEYLSWGLAVIETAETKSS